MTAGPSADADAGEQRLRIGGWTVEPALHRLVAGGRAVKLEPKAMAVLVYLARRPGQVVSRDALLADVWPGAVVGDDALTQVIVKLRKALGDVRDEPAYIQTIPKGGYRLVAEVTREGASAPSRDELSPQPAAAARAHVLAWPTAAAAVLLAVAAGAVWWTRADRPPGVAEVAREPTPPPIAQRAAAELPTVEIRPFEALGDDAQEALLARAITADLVTDLSKVSGLWVVGPDPAGAQRPGEAAARSVVARYVVSGSVQRSGDRLRLQVHLSEAQTARQLWSERFDRVLTDIFEIQDELGPKILQLLPVKVSEAEARRVAQRYTRSLEAYESFQRGQLALYVRRRADNEIARERFRRAIAVDAGFARAYAGLALTYAAEYRNQWVDDGAAALGRAFELARTAQQMDPDIPETHWALAFVRVHRHQHAQALLDLEAALRLNPSYADAYATMGGIYTSIGRPAESVPLLRTAMRLAPESGYLYLMLLGRAYLFLGDLEQARINLQHALARNPEFIDAHVYMAVAQLAAGDKAAAAWEAEEIRALQPAFSTRRWLETNPTPEGTLRTRLVGALAELGF